MEGGLGVEETASMSIKEEQEEDVDQERDVQNGDDGEDDEDDGNPGNDGNDDNDHNGIVGEQHRENKDRDEEEGSKESLLGDNHQQMSCAKNYGRGQEARGKTDKIREVVEQAASDDSKNKIEKLLVEIQQLSDLEKLLLYLRLPTGTTVEVDPLKQAFISSLGNRFEVTQTVTWIQTHLEEDIDVSLPKQEVYNGYCEFCQRVKMKPLSTADFGKVMKQVFPGVRPRRLGTRGNSRYCYAGLRKKLLLGSPQLPDLSLTHEESCEDGDPTDPELTGVSSHLVREWAEKLLGQKFSNLRELACHLVENAYVNNRSVAAFTLLSYLSSNGLGKRSQSCILMNQCAGSKHRETQLQLQRKLQERELIREQKKKLNEHRSIQALASDRIFAASEMASDKTKGSRKNQILTLRPQSSAEIQPRNLSFYSPTFENGTARATMSKSFDYGDSVDLETPKKMRNREESSSAAVRMFQPKKTSCNALSASTSPQPKFGAGKETMRLRSCSDGIIRPLRNSIATGDLDFEHEQRKQHQQSASFTSHIPELFRSSSFGSLDSKTGKVRIPRVVSSGIGASMITTTTTTSTTCITPASIIIFPQQISTSDYVNRLSPGGAGCQPSANILKPKYKPIQPKPIDRCSSRLSSDNEQPGSLTLTKTPSTTVSTTTHSTKTPVTSQHFDVEATTNDGGQVFCTSSTTVSNEGQQNGQENLSSIVPARSQLPSSGSVVDPTENQIACNSAVSTVTEKERRNDELHENEAKDGGKHSGRLARVKDAAGKRKQMKRTSSDSKRKYNSKNKRLCLPSSTSLLSSNSQSTNMETASQNSGTGGTDDKSELTATTTVVSPESEMSIGSLDKEAWAYLEGGISSVDQEEELLQYFGEDRAGNGEAEGLSPIQRDFTTSDTTGVGSSQSSELSQLRRLLERNLLQRAAANKDDHNHHHRLDDHPTITSSESMPTLRLLLSSTRQQQQQQQLQNQLPHNHAMDGDGITSDSCLSHASSRIPSPILAPGVSRSPPPLASMQYYASTALTRGDETGDLGSRDRGLMHSTLMLDASADYTHDMSSREGLWSSQESMYGSGVCKTSTTNHEEPMFSSSSESSCHAGVGPCNMYNPSSSVNLDDASRSSQQSLGGGSGVGNGVVGSGNDTTHLNAYNNGCRGYYQEATNYVASHQQQLQRDQHNSVQQTPCQSSSSSVPPSPNTRRRAFNFMPISPRDTPVPETNCSSATHSASHSPLFFTSNSGLTSGSHMTARTILTHTAPSLSASTATSPFVSPRSTPSSNCRSRHNSGQQLVIGGGGGGVGVVTSGVTGSAMAAAAATAAAMSASFRGATHTGMYLSEQQLPSSMTSSPFASPHPTPVPYSRSRHNSSQNMQRIAGGIANSAANALIYSSASSSMTSSMGHTRTRHASDIGMMSSMQHMQIMASSPDISPLNLHKDHLLNNSSRSRHNSNSSIPPNSPAAGSTSAPMSPMVGCGSTTQDVFSPGYLTSSMQQQQQQQQQQQNRHLHQTSSEVERATVNDSIGGPLNSSNYQHSIYRHHHVPPLDIGGDPNINPPMPTLQQFSTWPPFNRQPQSQVDPRLMSRQRHASMGATVHHYPLLPPPHVRPVQPPSADHGPAITNSSPATMIVAPQAIGKKALPPPLPLIDPMAASRCRSVPIYQMLENAIQQPELSTSATSPSSIHQQHHDHQHHHYDDDDVLSKSYPATPIAQQESFNFDARMARVDYSPMVGGGCNGSSSGRCGKSDEEHALVDVPSTDRSPATRPSAQTANGETLEIPASEFQDMLNTTLADLTYDDDISKFAQELEQYTHQ